MTPSFHLQDWSYHILQKRCSNLIMETSFFRAQNVLYGTVFYGFVRCWYGSIDAHISFLNYHKTQSFLKRGTSNFSKTWGAL